VDDAAAVAGEPTLHVAPNAEAPVAIR
jgi:hypothetical protein